jgi:hypothetical protein
MLLEKIHNKYRCINDENVGLLALLQHGAMTTARARHGRYAGMFCASTRKRGLSSRVRTYFIFKIVRGAERTRDQRVDVLVPEEPCVRTLLHREHRHLCSYAHARALDLAAQARRQAML